MTRKKKVKKYRPFQVLHVWTNGVEGDTCPKRGGKPLELSDGQCDGCRRNLGLGHFVTRMCAYS